MQIDNISRAIMFAAEKHMHQTRKDGSPYIYHPLEVCLITKEAGYGEEYQIAALLHDVLEDTDATYEDVAAFGDDVAEAVVCLTRKKGEDEAVYVDRILSNHIAAVVKNADKIHNLLECVYSGKGRRKPADFRFAKQYIEKAENYYRGYFSEELDSTIEECRIELRNIYVNKRKKGIDYEKMMLFSDQDEIIKKELLDERVSIKTDSGIFYQGLVALYYVEGWNQYVLTQAGWVRFKLSDEDSVSDFEVISKEEFTKRIERMKAEGYFYPEVRDEF